jgi:hypothetical protein
MTQYAHLLFLLLLSVTTFAQRADSVAAGDRPKTYVPGRWLAGLRYELIPFETQYRAAYAPGLSVGYNLLPRLSLQLGLTPTNLRGSGGSQMPPLAVLPPPSDTYTGQVNNPDFRPGLYVPIFLRYSFSKPFRRVQPYVTANLHAYLGGVWLTRYTYENGQLTNAPTETERLRNNGLGTAAGFGLRIRTIDRFFLSGEMGVGRTYQQNGRWPYIIMSQGGLTRFTALLGVGLTYEFR